eukprot:GHVS01098462.1.p1 GENE.GHVS01098462.1~~GHVS01098462.1.p1  ORF type:complete len:428 (+),score=117.24 GHVS01098462.1:120-1403(+)
MKFCLFAFLVVVCVASIGRAQDEVGETVPEVVVTDGEFLPPTADTSAWEEAVDGTDEEMVDFPEDSEVVPVTGDLEGRVIDVLELAPVVAEEGEDPSMAEEEEFVSEEDLEVPEDIVEILPGVPLPTAEEEDVPFVFDDVEPTVEEEELPIVETDDVFVPMVDPIVPEESEEAALLGPTEDEEEEVLPAVLSPSTSLLESVASDEEVGPVVSDPREGTCTDVELDNVKHFFSAHEDTCEAYQCVADYNRKFFESLLVHYNELWSEGGDAKVNSVASLLSACTCRCDMMKCEVDFMKFNSSPQCFESTIDYCENQNVLFVERCEKAATQYLDVINDVAPEAKWNTACPDACSRGSDPIAGLTLEPEVVRPSAGEEEETVVHMEEVPAQPGMAEEELIETMEEEGSAGAVSMSWTMAFGCAVLALVWSL